MRLRALIFMFFLLVSCISISSAENFSLDISQFEDKLVIKEISGESSSSYVDSESLERTSFGYYFVKKVNFDSNYDYAEVKLVLDKGFLLDTSVLYPANYEISSDGQNIELVWRFFNVSRMDSVALFVKISSVNAEGVKWVVFVAIVLGVLFLVYFFYLYRKKSNNFNEHLMESERKVIQELKKADKNELWQKELLINTGFSKAKLSRVVRDLEARDLVSKVSYGNTNKVKLR